MSDQLLVRKDFYHVPKSGDTSETRGSHAQARPTAVLVRGLIHCLRLSCSRVNAVSRTALFAGQCSVYDCLVRRSMQCVRLPFSLVYAVSTTVLFAGQCSVYDCLVRRSVQCLRLPCSPVNAVSTTALFAG